jgi:hypothetical protein
MAKDSDSARADALERLETTVALRKRDRKLETPLSDFPDGVAAGWHMAVPACFRDALDITWAERRKGGASVWQWIQGSSFDFKQGDTLYDTRKAEGTWADALRHLGLCIVVTDASPALPAKPAAVRPETPEDVPRDTGFVTFDILEPDGNRTALVTAGQRTLSQDAFIRFLICGDQDREDRS